MDNEPPEIITLDKMAEKLKRKEKVIAYLEEKAGDASSIVYDLAKNADTDSVKLAAAKDILDRAGFKPVEKTQSLNLSVDLKGKTNPELELIRDRYEAELLAKLIKAPNGEKTI